MNYQEWEDTVPQSIREDILWRIEAYRLALFAVDISWKDIANLRRDLSGRVFADQLLRALGSVSANIAEGYSRGTNKERAHFYEYALGSAREARDWYFKVRSFLPDEVIAHRIGLLTQIIRLLLVMVPDQRGRHITEDAETYEA